MKPTHPHAARYSADLEGVNQFTDYERIVARYTDNNDLGASFEVFAEAYLTVVKGYEVTSGDCISAKDRSRYNLSDEDRGIDGLYTDGGVRGAYQVKFKTGRGVLAMGGTDRLAMFFAESDEFRGAPRVVFTNARDMADQAHRRAGAQLICGTDLDRITPAQFDAMRSFLAGASAERERVTYDKARPHQVRAVEALVEKLSGADRAQAHMACGTGKTLMALWLAEKLAPRTIAVFAPTIALVHQIREEWLANHVLGKVRTLAVCSNTDGAQGEDVERVSDYELGFVSTDSERIAQWAQEPFQGTSIVFCTYQSSQRLAGLTFDLGVFDEAHRTVTGRTGKDSGMFQFALSDDRLKIGKRVFVTATPRHTAHRKADDYTMDDPDQYGEVAIDYPFSEAVEDDVIVPYKLIVSAIDPARISREMLENATAHGVDADHVARQIALAKAIEHVGAKKAITFHRDIKRAESWASDGPAGLSQHLPEEFDVLHVSSNQTARKRRRMMADFAGPTPSVITNAQCLTEGVDVPAVDMVAFMSPRRSGVTIVQAAGRAMRKAEGKEYGYILMPVFWQEGDEQLEEAATATKFNDVQAVLERLLSFDSALAEKVGASIAKGKKDGFKEAVVDAIEVVGMDYHGDLLREAITARVVEGCQGRYMDWWARLAELRDYMAEHGKTPPQPTKLGGWVMHQRRAYSGKGTSVMTPERIAALESIEGWEWDPQAAAWQRQFEEVRGYMAEHGKTPPKGTKLGAWVMTQRTAYSGTHSSYTLSPERIAALESIEGWEWDPHAAAWQRQCEEVRGYMAEHGKIPPQSTKLGVWAKGQRQAYHGTGAFVLSPERIAALESIPGWSWGKSRKKSH